MRQVMVARCGWMATVGIAASLLLGSRPATAQEFRPFTKVKNVCPTCPELGYDKIDRKNGKPIYAVVVAENPQFYVLLKHGEFRAIGRDLVDKIEHTSKTSSKGYGDQVILDNGVVLAGKVVRTRADTGMYQFSIPPNNETIFVYKQRIWLLYENGKKVYQGKKPARS